MRPLCSNKQPVKLKSLWTASLLVLVTMVTSARSEVVMGEDGGYRNLVVRISDSLDMNKCADIIQGVKVSQRGHCASKYQRLQLFSHRGWVLRIPYFDGRKFEIRSIIHIYWSMIM